MTMTLSKRQSQAGTSESQAIDIEALFQQYWERLCRLLYQIVGDMDEAQDLALEAYVQLYRRPPGEVYNLGGWLYRVATNLGLNTLRARKRRQRYEQQAGSLALETAATSDPAMRLERSQDQESVRTALSKMKPRAAQILLLRHSGLSYAEIAEAVGVAPGSVGKLLARAEREFEKRYVE
jgi:RNA polymerase sigma-70 factor (ECF subfamily)